MTDEYIGRDGGMVYAEDLKSLTRKSLWVRVPLPALKLPKPEHVSGFVMFLPRVGLERFCGAARSVERVAKSGPRNFLVRRHEKMFLAEPTLALTTFVVKL